jgi:hypothetical protein
VERLGLLRNTPRTRILLHANRSACVPNAHIDDAPIVRLAIKGSVDFHTPLAKLRADVIGKHNKRPASVRSLNSGIPFIDFRVHVLIPHSASNPFAPSHNNLIKPQVHHRL